VVTIINIHHCTIPRTVVCVQMYALGCRREISRHRHTLTLEQVGRVGICLVSLQLTVHHPAEVSAHH